LLIVHGMVSQVLAQLLLDLDSAVATVTARCDGRMESSLRCGLPSIRSCYSWSPNSSQVLRNIKLKF
jgi:hypothetical protein